MKSYSFTLFCCLLLALSGFAQDKIYFKNGNTEAAKILEINKDDVAFKKNSNPDGPTYRELKTKIDKIVYANGTTENFGFMKVEQIKIAPATLTENSTDSKKEPDFVFKKNDITFSVSDVLFKRATFAYERIFGKGYIGVKIPVSFGLGSNKVFDVDYLNSYNDDGNTQNYYYSYYVPADETNYTSIIRKNTFGLELKAYPFGQKPVSFFVGPAFYYGLLDIAYQETRYILDNSGGYNNYTSIITAKKDKTTSYSGLINTGFVFKSTTDFTIHLQIGLGFRKNNASFEEYTATIFNPSFQIGYTF